MKQAILDNLADPGWWFTVVFVGLIVGLFSGYLKDWLSRILSTFSAKYREKRELDLVARTKYVQELSEDATQLVISFLACVINAIYTLCFFTMFVLIPILAGALKANPEFSLNLLDLGSPGLRSIVLFWSAIPIGIFTIYRLVLLRQHMSLAFDAFHAYRTKQKHVKSRNQPT